MLGLRVLPKLKKPKHAIFLLHYGPLVIILLFVPTMLCGYVHL